MNFLSLRNCMINYTNCGNFTPELFEPAPGPSSSCPLRSLDIRSSLRRSPLRPAFVRRALLPAGTHAPPHSYAALIGSNPMFAVVPLPPGCAARTRSPSVFGCYAG
jgi:hypothetical protein